MIAQGDVMILDLHAVGRQVAALAVEVGVAHIERILARCHATASITRSMASMPCGPPNPRKAVLDTVFVFNRRLEIANSGRK